MRRSAVPHDTRSAVPPEAQPSRRPAVSEVARLGWFYGPLNQLAPLVRLLAIVTFVRGGRWLLWPAMASIAASLALRPLTKLADRLVAPQPSTAAETAPLTDEEGGGVSAATVRTRLLLAHVLQLGLFVALLCVGGVDRVSSGLDPDRPDPTQAATHGAAVAALAAAMWFAAQRLLGAQRRDDLTMADSTKDISSSTEDELVLLMPPAQRVAFVAVRCARLALDTLADMVLFFVFLPDMLSDEPALAFYGAALPVEPQSALAALLAALCYASQHLRFQGEWLLGLGMGMALVVLGRYSGDLRASFVAATLFAVLRYLNRTRDVRSLHGA